MKTLVLVALIGAAALAPTAADAATAYSNAVALESGRLGGRSTAASLEARFKTWETARSALRSDTLSGMLLTIR